MPTSVVRLPSMDLIRSFVTVGRRMSITLASADLYITQSAVSRQIHALEELLGVKLLVRGHRSLAFTPEGERLFWVADTAIRQLQDVVGSISIAKERRPVTISAPVGFAGLWLLPRMSHFQSACSGIDLRVSANSRLVDLRAEGVDLAVRYCTAAAAPKGAVRLFGEQLAPVASPTLRDAPLEDSRELASYFLLEFDDVKRGRLQWGDWLGEREWDEAKPKGILRFNQYDQVIYAALAGQGIALGRLELLGTMLKEKKLTVLAPPRRLTEGAYAHWLVPGNSQGGEDVREVMAWIQSHAELTERESVSLTLCAGRPLEGSHAPNEFHPGKKVV